MKNTEKKKEEEAQKWLKEKVVLELTRQEMFDLANVFFTADRNDESFLKIKDKKLRGCFERAYRRRHKLWLKITHLADDR